MKFKVGDPVRTNERDFAASGYLIWPSVYGKTGRVVSTLMGWIPGCTIDWGFDSVYNTVWHEDNLVLAEEGVVDKILTKYSNA